jgi:hypothetical protein
MIDALFGTYYGLDWLSMVLGFYGAWAIGDRKPVGFIITGVSVVLAMIVAIIASQYGFIVANMISLAIAMRNWRRWKADEKLEFVSTPRVHIYAERKPD